jgi:hypothetical protein
MKDDAMTGPIKDGMIVDNYREEREAAAELGYEIEIDCRFDFVITHPHCVGWKHTTSTVRGVVEFVHAVKLAHEVECKIAAALKPKGETDDDKNRVGAKRGRNGRRNVESVASKTKGSRGR